MGRKDQQVKIRGYRVELGEVETALARHPAVRDCVVSVSSDARGSNRLVAYVVPRDGEAPESRDLRRFVGARLPDPMVPSSYVFLEALPFRPNGKIDRDALPPAVFEVSSAEYVAPRHPAEQLMADLWCELMGVDRVGVNDNFFELGGDSITAIQITARVRAVGVAMTPWLVFQHQTIAELVAALASAPAPADGANAIEPAAPALDLTDDDIAQLAARVEFEAS
jgi:aryl carrier-like protein